MEGAVSDLARRLASDDELVVDVALDQAYLLLDQSDQLRSAAAIAERGDLPPAWRGVAERLAANYRKALPAEYAGLLLSADEVSALTAALVRVPNRMPRLAAGTARALGATRRLPVLPILSGLLRRHAADDLEIALCAIKAIRTVLVTVGDTAGLGPEGRKVVGEALDALRLAARDGAESGPLSAKSEAAQELGLLERLSEL